MVDSLIYIASPFTTEDPQLKEYRFEVVCAVCAVMMRESGLHVFSPIAHGYPIAKYGLPTDWGYWEDACKVMISRCQRFVVVMLDGWDKSTGVLAEIEYAKKMGLNIEYIDPWMYVEPNDFKIGE
jgi:hypothetical protein